MSKGNEPALVAECNDEFKGRVTVFPVVTRRDLFAAMAMAGLLTNPAISIERVGKSAVECADALIAALYKDGKDNG